MKPNYLVGQSIFQSKKRRERPEIADLRITIASGDKSWNYTIAALASPLPIDSASCPTVDPSGNSRTLPSGNVISAMTGTFHQNKPANAKRIGLESDEMNPFSAKHAMLARV